MILSRPVAQRANLMAASIVSVPLLQKNTRDSESGRCLVSISAANPLSRPQSIRTRLGMSRPISCCKIVRTFG